nr:MAG TPA: hypothetical protein [Caudoviricetes sp.]
MSCFNITTYFGNSQGVLLRNSIFVRATQIWRL